MPPPPLLLLPLLPLLLPLLLPPLARAHTAKLGDAVFAARYGFGGGGARLLARPAPSAALRRRLEGGTPKLRASVDTIHGHLQVRVNCVKTSVRWPSY